MNKELLIKYYDIKKEYKELSNKIYMINNILVKYSNLFCRKESIKSINNLKEYYENLKKQIYIKEKNIKEIRSKCDHKIVKLNYNQKVCIICGKVIQDKDNYVYLITDDSKSSEIFKLFKNNLYNNDDLEEILDDYIFKNEGMKKLRR